MFATEQCLLVLTHHPAVWHQAAQFLDQSSKALTDKGVRIVFSYNYMFDFQDFVANMFVGKQMVIGYRKTMQQLLPILFEFGQWIRLSINCGTLVSHLNIQTEIEWIFYLTTTNAGRYWRNCIDTKSKTRI